MNTLWNIFKLYI